ncbi:methyltransferase domain-containing protein [Yinghuangia sp. ASG 101]|uniref:methyltransferase domain-containing protein n=1 Tax=Yinghuangia sp. ASG 101 TaxID=2896848 RepID=UPI001E2BEAF5|nr:methyltransferase domain-containing protein [Yinghuangia sp. ASG 101]UGQ15118.1 methyltransferase domain-containing protein [Yinghuangia sp. ASG 101]
MHSSTAWNPLQALKDSDPRTRPFHDLLARVPDPPGRPARIADLGCGTGSVTALLAARWPDAHITGFDNCAESLAVAEEFARQTAGGGLLEFRHGDIAEWIPDEPFDLVISSAAIQWVADHPYRFEAWTRTLPIGGVFAFQVPDNAAAASHTALRELCAGPRWRDRLGPGIPPSPKVWAPVEYLDHLGCLGFAVDAWEATYAHVLPTTDPFAGWVGGTGMRPVVNALADEPGAAEEFFADYLDRLREVYPATPYGTVFPFRRIFAVARKEETA